MKTFDTLSDAIQDLKTRGYHNDFNLHPEWIECSPDLKFKPTEFHVDEVYRFEGITNPDDNCILFAIQSSNGVKGVLVDAYGAYSDSLSPEMVQALKIDENTLY
jgi:hypothetical protein